ncbi:unnamed protein product, partial [marine sediment metagenome]
SCSLRLGAKGQWAHKVHRGIKASKEQLEQSASRGHGAMLARMVKTEYQLLGWVLPLLLQKAGES